LLPLAANISRPAAMTLREMADQQTLSGPKPAEVASSAARVATRGQWWSPLGGTHIATCSNENTVRLWRIAELH
jgi:hypothetical protein